MVQKASGNRPVVFGTGVANKLVDIVNQHDAERLGRGLRGSSHPRNMNVVKVRNSSGGNLARGSVLRVNGDLCTGLDDYDADRWIFTGSTPSAAQTYGILRNPTPDGEIDELQLSGVCIARVDVVDADHTHAGPVSGDTFLTSALDGPFVILDKPTGTGEKECVVVFRGATERSAWVAKTGTAIAAMSGDTPGSGTVTLYELSGSSFASTGTTVTAYNISTEEVAATTYIQIKRCGNIWVVDFEACS